ATACRGIGHPKRDQMGVPNDHQSLYHGTLSRREGVRASGNTFTERHVETMIAAATAEELKALSRSGLAEAQRILDQIVGHRGPRRPDNTLDPYNRLAMA